MQWCLAIRVQGPHICAVLQKHLYNFHMSIFRRPFQWAPVGPRLIPGFNICAMFEEDSSNLGMTLSRCHKQRSLAGVKAPSVYVLQALNDQELDNVM